MRTGIGSKKERLPQGRKTDYEVRLSRRGSMGGRTTTENPRPIGWDLGKTTGDLDPRCPE